MGYHYGQTIRMYRQQRGLSQSELAERWPRLDGETGVNIRYVQDIEYGKKRIGDPCTLRSVAALLDIPLWQFGLSEYDPFHPTAWPAFDLLKDFNRPPDHPTEQQEPNDLQHIPPAYYERILHTYTQVEPALFSWTMWNLGLLQLHSQMNYARQQDVSIAVFKCSPPNPQVCSMYEIARYSFYLSPAAKIRFSGKESLAGQTVQEGRMLLEGNSCSAPITRRNRVGACLIVQFPSAIISSDIEIIQRYADLFSLAFFDHEFYIPQDIDLCTIPPDLRQDILLQEFDLQRLDLVSLNTTDPDRIRRAEQLILQSVALERPGEVDVSTR
jgi:transcriptional regulator with XRE-family HTH domain